MDRNIPIVYLNGQYLPKGEAALSVEDRGTLFGDGVYEVIRYYGGRPLAMAEHVARFRNSLRAIHLAEPPEFERLPEITDEVLSRSGIAEAKIYWQITRGACPRDYPFPPAAGGTGAVTRPSVLVMPYAVPALRDDEPLRSLKAVLLEDQRWHNCWIKAITLLPNMLAYNEALARGADVAILHRGERITETPSANAFAVRGGELWTHPADHWILGGVTRLLVLRLAGALGIPVRETAVTRDELRRADEVFITGTTTHVAAVTQLDGRPVGNGAPGPVTRRLYEALLALIREQCLLQPA